MNKANLKSYAPKARLDFIKAVTERANVLGISAAGVVPAEVRGDIALIDGREWPAKVAGQRDELIARIKRHGFEQTMDEVAYTWFNRFAALRYMEIHDYLGHGWRVLSSRDGGLPEILRHASEVTLPGLNADRARQMQLAGNQDNELYKLLLVAQCNELSRVMPFLFERIDDETELLLPENLLRTDSIVAKLVEQVPEEDWQEIEVIGWLYQFYISEKKDQVIGKVVKSEDIPAATQLFTPNWIVQYLVQNSVGRLWLMANPTSTLASQWPYYVQPAEQTPEVQAQLDALVQTRIRADGETLNPETITVLDPACGSGHILVVAYDVLKAIYLERGYQPRTIPRLILEKNLFGLDIDDRAAQLAAFALMMKARADDRRLFNDPPKLNVLSLQESKGLNVDELASQLATSGLQRATLMALIDVFEHAKTFGSLIQLPPALARQLAQMTESLQHAVREGDLYVSQAAKEALLLVRQAILLNTPVDAVIANPPYMGGNGMNTRMREFAQSAFPDHKSDMFAMFVKRGFDWCKPSSFNSMVTMQSWMFLSSYESMRKAILGDHTISTFVQIGFNSFPEINSKVAQACAFSVLSRFVENSIGRYINLNLAPQSADKQSVFESRNSDIVFDVLQNSFGLISGSPLAYWASDSIRRAFSDSRPLSALIQTRLGMSTADNGRFLRHWFEVSIDRVALPPASRGEASAAGRKWLPYQKGGEFRKWYGNNLLVVNWSDDGREIKSNQDEFGRVRSHNYNDAYGLRRGITWSDVTSGINAFRYMPAGFLFDGRGSAGFADEESSLYFSLGLLNSKVAYQCLGAINQTLAINVGEIAKVPVHAATADIHDQLVTLVAEAISIARSDWDSSETSWDFGSSPWLSFGSRESIESSWLCVGKELESRLAKMRSLEEMINALLISSYDLKTEILPDVTSEQITLSHPDREKACRGLISYAIGCIMGRYSLDEPGLIYAHAGNFGFDPSRYEERFPADADGIVPTTDERWFEEDAASRVREFLQAVWGPEMLAENNTWLAASLGAKGTETPDEAIRRYLADKFYKDHLQAYKKRPIYWLFSSGKQGAFQAFVYLHRYNEGTLARMRAEYVVPLIAKMASRLDMLDKDVAAASSAAARTKVQKQIESLRKKQIELLAYDEKLRHHADMRITLDLDDGVKVNYAKFGDLVAESKAITGGREED